MDKNRSQFTAVASTRTSLFDVGKRTYKGFQDRDESCYSFLNRSGWESVETVRKTLDNWFFELPEGKRKDIWSRFRSDDRQHQGALLELATHQLLHSICTDVQVDPSFSNLTPDFAATYAGAKFVVECTVAQESDQDFGAAKREESVKKAVDSIDTGRLHLMFDLLATGPTQPPTGELRCTIKEWVESLDPDEEKRRLEQKYSPRELRWSKYGWKVLFKVIHVDSRTKDRKDKRAISLEAGTGVLSQDDTRLKRALTAKAKKYRDLSSPFLVVLSAAGNSVIAEDLTEALFGQYTPISYNLSLEFVAGFQLKFLYDGLFGSSSSPKHRNLSAILFKSRIGVWTLCGHDDPWLLLHHPWAEYPLPSGMFPFATEWIPKSGEFAKVGPVVTLNAVLGLADPWPGMER